MRTRRTYFRIIAWASLLFATEISGASPLSQVAPIPVGYRDTMRAEQDLRILEPGVPVERELSSGRIHTYQLKLTSDQYLCIVAEQRAINVVLSLFGPEGQLIVKSSSKYFPKPEVVSMIAEKAGEYRLEVSARRNEGARGNYLLKISELRGAVPKDHIRIAAERTYGQALELFVQETAQSRQGALKKFEEALALWQKVENRQEEARTLQFIGSLHQFLGENQKALGRYKQALSLREAGEDRSEEAETRNSLGLIYNLLGESQTALTYFSEALKLRRELEDLQGQALVLTNIGAIHSRTGELQKALECYREALELRRTLNDDRGKSLTLQNLGTAYFRLGEIDQAIDYYRQALQLRQAIKDRDGQIYTLLSIGLCYRVWGEFD